MAPTEPEAYKGVTKVCSRCSAKDNCTFCYLDNGKLDQPRYKCLDCKKLFAFVDHGRSHNKKYAKKRNVDPEELRDLPRQCPHCKCANRVPFKYYNNKITTQPVFQCLQCKKRFQMRIETNATERRLVHTGRAAQDGHNEVLHPPKRNTIHPHVACSPSMSEDAVEAIHESTWAELSAVFANEPFLAPFCPAEDLPVINDIDEDIIIGSDLAKQMPTDEELLHDHEMDVSVQAKTEDDMDLDSFAELLEMDLVASEQIEQLEPEDDIDLDSFAELLEMDLTAIEEIEETQRECSRLMRQRTSHVTWLPDPMDSTALALRQALASF